MSRLTERLYQWHGCALGKFAIHQLADQITAGAFPSHTTWRNAVEEMLDIMDRLHDHKEIDNTLPGKIRAALKKLKNPAYAHEAAFLIGGPDWMNNRKRVNQVGSMLNTLSKRKYGQVVRVGRGLYQYKERVNHEPGSETKVGGEAQEPR